MEWVVCLVRHVSETGLDSTVVLVLQKLLELGPDRDLHFPSFDDVGVPLLLVVDMEFADEHGYKLEVVSVGDFGVYHSQLVHTLLHLVKQLYVLFPPLVALRLEPLEVVFTVTMLIWRSPYTRPSRLQHLTTVVTADTFD